MLANDIDVNNPVPLAIAVLVDRIRRLSKEDRDDLYELTKALISAECEEEYQSAVNGMREILEQQVGTLQAVPLACDGDEDISDWTHYVGGRIKRARKAAGLTQAELAQRAGLPQPHVSRLERGDHSPTAKTLEKLAAALEIPVSHFDPSASNS